MKKGKVLLLALAIVFMGLSGHAMPIHIEEGTLSLTGEVITDASQVIPEVTEPDETAQGVAETGSPAPAAEGSEAAPEGDGSVTVQGKDFHLLARTADGGILIFADGQFLKVPEDSLAKVLQQTGGAYSLPLVEKSVVLKRRDNSGDVRALQEALVALGFLTGSADGDFGAQTERALSAFGETVGMANVTQADTLMMLLIASAQADTVNIVPNYDPIQRYAIIAGNTRANLAAAAEYGLNLEYDDIAGTGALTNGAVYTLDATNNSDIDSYFFEIRFILMVNQMADGEIVVEPAVRVNCDCVRRPIMQDMILKLGDTRCTIPFTGLSNTLTGPRSTEIATGALTPDAVKMLANPPEEGILKLRINGKYQSFDCEIEDIASISTICKAAQGL